MITASGETGPPENMTAGVAQLGPIRISSGTSYPVGRLSTTPSAPASSWSIM
ncbi:MAG: hypothetical protein M5U19_05365 [Microthrixaceae bacterium]|nr:hypothetical protein [Microthrixaceae bacterium]